MQTSEKRVETPESAPLASLFKKAQRVCRAPLLHLTAEIAPRVGTITEVYSSTPTHVGEYFIQYAVRWDDTGLEERGYIDSGLKPLQEHQR